MRTGRSLGIFGVVALGAIVILPQAQAQVNQVARATSYRVQLVRAYDECVGPGITIVNPGSVAGCAAANVDTDDEVMNMTRGNLAIIPNSRLGAVIRLSANGVSPTTVPVGLQLTFRTTNTLGLPPATTKTYEDVTIICGDTAGTVCGNSTAIKSNGRVQLRTTLADCLAANGLNSNLLAGSQSGIEFVDAGLVNCNTGEIFAVPGVKLK